MKSICGADCENCGYGKNSNCKGCIATDGCPFGKKCFIARYIKTGGMDNYKIFRQQIINEFNALEIEGMPEITELFALNGAFVNLAYPMPNGKNMKFLDDNEIYLGTQAECLFDDGDGQRCFGLVAGMDFLLVSEYGINGSNPEIIIYKRR